MDNNESAVLEGVDNSAAAPVEMAIPATDTRAEEMNELKATVSRMAAEMDALKRTPVKSVGAATPATDKDAAAVKNFGTYIRTGVAVKAALNEGTAGQGGYLVPVVYDNQMVEARRYASILRRAGARVIPVSGTNSVKITAMTDSAAAVLTSEAASFDQKEPTFSELTFTPYKFTKLSKASDEVLADSRFPVESILMTDAAQAFAAAENSYFATGTGSSQPQGVVTGSSLGKTAAGTAAITTDELIDLYHSLTDLYRQNAVWLMNDATLAAIRKLKDTTNQYLWQPGLSAGAPSTLLGRPVYTLSTMPTLATGAKTVIFGDLSYFWIMDFAGMEMMRLNELYAANGQVGFRWYSRFDSKVVLSAAIKHLIQA